MSNRNPSRLHLALLIVSVFLVLTAVLPASAASGTLDFTLSCAGFESNGSELWLERDNTGALSEAFVVSAIDGAGNTIFEPVSDVFFIGGRILWPEGDAYAWTTAPRYNPLRMRIISLAGNGLEEEIVADVSGACAGLPTFGRIDVDAAFEKQKLLELTGEAFVLQPSDGETAPAVPLNTAPPRPINPDGLAESQPGYAIVNTDNLSLRSGDSPRYSLVGVIDGGTRLAVLGRNADQTWWYVQVGGMRGWVKAEFLILRGDLTGIPEVPVLGELAQPRLYVGFSGNPVYVLPKPGSDVVCTIPGNRDYAIIGRDAGSNWYEIEVTCGLNDVAAWIPAEFGIVRNPGGVFISVTH